MTKGVLKRVKHNCITIIKLEKKKKYSKKSAVKDPILAVKKSAVKDPILIESPLLPSPVPVSY